MEVRVEGKTKHHKCNRCRRHTKDTNKLNKYNDYLCFRCRMVIDDMLMVYGHPFKGMYKQHKILNQNLLSCLVARIRFWYLWKFYNGLFVRE